MKQLTLTARPEELESLIASFPAARSKYVNTRAILLALRGV